MDKDMSSPVAEPRTINLTDYRPPDFLIDSVDLIFDLREDGATVAARTAFRRNQAVQTAAKSLQLDGGDLELASIALNGVALGENRFRVEKSVGLTVTDPPDEGVLDIVTEIKPHENKSLEGLYKSGGNFCTQCEAEGFRNITFFPDRPDVLTTYTVTIVADKASYPVLLSNGNLVDQGASDGGRHWAKWHDPHPKPSYLFALVAGDLVSLDDSFTTRSSREVTLKIYTKPEDLDKCAYAMSALKNAMRWDEEVFGLEYDLDLFNIVAVGDFNAGAMENKGLNIFNTALLLAHPDTATDADYQRVESVVAHEYFHNWTGNRITCRDWFQLTLKEGLTVFRDQLFSADHGDPAIERINQARRLRAMQFPEDAGPLAHPIRPESYIEVNNFYTATVYEKGAEVIRMIHTLIGKEAFRKGMDLYVQRHDGQAVRCEDFVAAMEDASGVDLGAFRKWYSQAGTPTVSVDQKYDEAARTLDLTFRQSTPPTPGQKAKQPVVIPMGFGLIAESGAPADVHFEDQAAVDGDGHLLVLADEEQTVRLTDVAPHATASLLRGFSAPVQLRRSDADRALPQLFAHDTDSFARWDAGQQWATACLLDMVSELQSDRTPATSPELVDAFATNLEDDSLTHAFKAELLVLPTEDFLADQMAVVDVEAIYQARQIALGAVGAALIEPLKTLYDQLAESGPYRPTTEAMGQRSLKALALALIAAGEESTGIDLAKRQFDGANNMTDTLAALTVLRDRDHPARPEALDSFYERWKHEPLVVDKWFALQASSRLPGTVDRVRELLDHPAFTIEVPNRARALIGAFAFANPRHFHAADGGGYDFLADQVLRLDEFNPHVAARMLSPLGRWARQDAARQGLMKAALGRIVAKPGLSKNVYEIASKSLA
ncbi:MAG: aminopeptidase N [Pseudomonadota bacterium]